MNARGDITDTYSEARRLLKERWRDASGTVSCPECNMTALDWEVVENTLSTQCELCGTTESMQFTEEVSWSDDF